MRRTTSTGCLVAVVTLGASLLAVAYIMNSCTAGVWSIFGPSSGPAPIPQQWSQLKEGMTKPEVEELLGTPLGRLEAQATPNRRYPYVNFWEYGVTSSFRQDPFAHAAASKAYVVHFDTNQVVVSWREPIKGDLPY